MAKEKSNTNVAATRKHQGVGGNRQRNNRWFDTSGLLCSDGEGD